MRVFIMARHGQSLLNLDHLVNGDPSRDPGLSNKGIEDARTLGKQLSAVAVGVAIVSPFPRVMQTADLALEGRDVPRVVDEDLGDIRLGELEGGTVEDYRAATAHGDRDRAFRGGETLNDAARRYARAFERLLGRDEPVSLLVSHEIAVRYAINAAAGSDDLDGPAHAIGNATPYVFDEVGLQVAVTRMRELAG